MVFPEARRQDVETIIRDALGAHHGGTESLDLVIVRITAPKDWAVHASGLGDPVLEASYSDVIRQALQTADL